MVMIRFLFAICLILFSYGFSYDDVIVDAGSVAKKLETAPVAYYGSLVSDNGFNQDQLIKINFEKDYPQVHKSFVEWSELKTARIKRDLAEAPEIVRKTFNLLLKKEFTGFYIIHKIVRVDKVYNKTSKTWENPKPEDKKKVLTQFAYVGPDIVRDSSSFKLIERVLTIPYMGSEDVPLKRVFFIDGVSAPIAFLEDSYLENVQFFPYRLNYTVEPNYAIEVRERMEKLVSDGAYKAAALLADSADLSLHSKALLKFLSEDYDFIANEDSLSDYWVTQNSYNYEDGLDHLLKWVGKRIYREKFRCEDLPKVPDRDNELLCVTIENIALGKYPGETIKRINGVGIALGGDLGIPFLVGDFPDYKPFLYFDVGFGVRIYDVVVAFEFTSRAMDAKCDSCGNFDYGIQSRLGYRLFETKYFEGVAFVNVGGAFYVVPDKEDEKRKNKQEGYFRYGAGAYVDLLVPSFIGTQMPLGDPFAGRVAFRLKAGFHNMKASKYGHADGISPYISLGLWIRGDFVGSR